MPTEADTQVVEAVGQDGVSPKVQLPAWALTAIGVVLLVIGYVLGDPTLQAIGWTSLGTGPLAGLLGFLPKPGNVIVPAKQLNSGPASDAVLADKLSEKRSTKR